MRAKRRLTIGLVLMMLLVILAGCGTKTDTQEPGTNDLATQAPDDKEAEVKEDVTAAEFITKMITAADGTVVTKSDCKTLLQALVGDNYNCIQIDNLYTTHNEYDKETLASRSEIMLENQNGSFSAVYNLTEELGVLYYYANEGDDRIKYEACLEKEEISRNFVSGMNLENAEVLGFETEGLQYNGQDVYKLSVKLKDANIRELIFETGMMWLFWAKEYASIDLSDITVTMDYYVEPKTAQVLKVEARLEGMKNFLTECGLYNFGAYYGHVLDVVELHECKMVYENISYEDYTLPKMSFEDKKNSVLVHQKDTPYTLKMLNDEVEVICPAGWCVEEQGEDCLTIYRADDCVYINYYLEYGYTPEEYLNEIIAGWVEFEKENDDYISDGMGPKMGVYDTYEIVFDNEVDAFAYTTVGDSLFWIEVFDYTTNRADRALPEVLERVHFVE